MNRTLKLLGVFLLILYTCVTVLSMWKLYYLKVNANLHKKGILPHHVQQTKSHTELSGNKVARNSLKTYKVNKVEVWGKAAIGTYFWTHIMKGRLQNKNSLVKLGNVSEGKTVFTFRTGPGIIQSTVPYDVEHLVLILNGRSQEKIDASIMWLDYLPHYSNLKKLAIILLGNEECENNWLWPYMKSHGGKVDIVFMVYDSPVINNVEFYQWPLGVAVYRGFPNILPAQVDVMSRRPYICNFLGTVYENSSRVLLTRVIESSGFQDRCIIKGRQKWLPLETPESFSSYMHALSSSDLTLSPVGKNSECYRIYEAMSLGSVPVIEDIITPGFCEKSSMSPLRLFKKYNAPVIYIKSWHDLPDVLRSESQITLAAKVTRRRTVVKWYKKFKEMIHDEFVKTIEDKFFGR